MSDEQILTERDHADKLAAFRERDDWRAQMGTPTGRRVIWNMLCSAGIFTSTFRADTHLMAYAEGRRAYGLEILDKINTHCPEQYDKMRRENITQRDNDE